MKKISIIMPLYNSAQYLKEAIDSILNQTYKNWELIIINEFDSNDGSKDIVEEYIKKDKRIKLIQNTKKEGIAESLNIGLRAATGEYIARMDADDISGKYRLEKQLKYLENNKDIGLCGIVPTFFGTQTLIWPIETNPEIIKHNIFFYTPCVHPTIMFRREIIEKYNIFYNSDFKATEDYEFFSRVCGVSKISNIEDRSLFKYRMTKSNATNRNIEIGIQLHSEVMRYCFKNYLNLEFNDEELKILNCNYSITSNGEELYNQIVKLDFLMKQILFKTIDNKNYNIQVLFNTLQKRWKDLQWKLPSKEMKNNRSIYLFFKNSIFYKYNHIEFSQQIDNPNLSIILPIYEQNNYILETINSIINQTYKNFEFIIVINKFEQENLNWLKIFSDKRIKIKKQETKSNLQKLIEIGIKESKGNFIEILNIGAVYETNKFEKEIKCLEQNKNKNVVVSQQRFYGDYKEQSFIYKINKSYINVLFRNNKNIKINKEQLINNLNKIKYINELLSSTNLLNMPKENLNYLIDNYEIEKKYYEKEKKEYIKKIIFKIKKLIYPVYKKIKDFNETYFINK